MARPTTGASYLTFGLVILGGFVFTAFVTVPSWSGWQAARARHSAKLAEQSEKATFLANIDARTVELGTHAQDAQALAVMFPETPSPAELAQVLHTIASRNGVILDSVGVPVRPSVEQGRQQDVTRAYERGGTTPAVARTQGAQDVSVRYEVKVAARGSYGQLRAFLADLERSLRFFDVSAIELTASEATEGEAVPVLARADITLWGYRVAPAVSASIGVGGSPAPAPVPLGP